MESGGSRRKEGESLLRPKTAKHIPAVDRAHSRAQREAVPFHIWRLWVPLSALPLPASFPLNLIKVPWQLGHKIPVSLFSRGAVLEMGHLSYRELLEAGQAGRGRDDTHLFCA